MKLGDKVRASYPYGGVPACEGKIIKELVLRGKITQFFVSFEVRPTVFKNFYLTERELTLCPSPGSNIISE
ncbi:hypothetical protein BH10CHL1_BH10CHL1_41390 [soil metagenome]